MARYNEILVGRYNRRLQKLLGMKGEPPAPQLSSEISTSLLLFSGNEERYLEGWNLFAIAGFVLEVGGLTPVRIRLRNPPGSGVVGVLYFWNVSSSVAGEFMLAALGPTAGNLPTVLSGQRLDARVIVATGTLVPSTDTAGGSGSPQILRVILGPAGSNTQLLQDTQHEIPILPGDSLEFGGATVAAGSRTDFSLMWRERFLEESERT